VLDAGKIVERGTHDELVEEAGRYAALLSGADLAAPYPPPSSSATIA
jgi:hypothetical protein